MKADKLKPGDEIRIISPSRSMSLISVELRELAVQRLNDMGFQVSFGKHVLESDAFTSSSIESRVEDLHEAFSDPQVKAILTTIGGFNCNQILRYLDYSLIQANPKRLCGYSDISALSNAIFAKTGLVSYSGPHFSTFGMKLGLEYTMEYFQHIMFSDEKIVIRPSTEWSDDEWYVDQEDRSFIQNEGPFVINEGEANGVIVGGNLCTLNLLQGTEFMPNLAGTLLFVEDDNMSSPVTFDRDLQSLIHQPEFNQVRGLVVGRFQKASQMNKALLTQIIKSKKELNRIPVIADVDFGHTSPMITFPIGGRAVLEATPDHLYLSIKEE